MKQESYKDSTQDNVSGAITPDEKLQKPVTTAGRNEDYLKRKLEQEEKDKKAAAEKQASMDKANNCERAKSYQQSLEAGVSALLDDKETPNAKAAPQPTAIKAEARAH